MARSWMDFSTMDDDWDAEVSNGPVQQAPQYQPPAGPQVWVGRGRGQAWAPKEAAPAWGAQNSGQSWGGQNSNQSWGAQNSGQSWGAPNGAQDSGQSWGAPNGAQEAGGWRGRGGGRGGRGGGGRSDAPNWRGGGGGGDGGGRPPPQPTGLHMMVNSSDVSRIIGRAGSNIRELENNSGAKIRVVRDAGGPHEARVDFSGDPECQERAKLLVEQFLIDFDANPRPASRRPGRSPSPVPRKPYSGDTLLLGGPAAPPAPTFSLKLALEMQAEGDKERWSKLPPLLKDFYEEDPTVATMPEDQVAQLRAEMNDVHVSCDEGAKNVRFLNPVSTFDQAFAPYPEILDELKRVGFEKPTPIQSQGWPVLLSGQDLIGIAQTGSGKTLAFLLPALIHTDRQPVPREDRGGPNVLVLAPTRELALQTEREVQRYNYKGIRSVCVYGGGDRRQQVKAVCKGVEIIIATPGRLNDLVQAGTSLRRGTRRASGGSFDVSSVTYLVLDEADRMLDMGFEPEIRKVLLDIRPDRQTVMTSATWPIDVRRIADKYMSSPIHVVVGTLDLRACRTVEQVVLFCRDEEEKKERLDEYLYNMGPEEKIIVFFGRKAKASQLSIDYGVNGIDLQSIHGDRPQEEREIAIEDMQTGSLIINFDFPREIEDYVHRVGRTGRAGKSGRAVTLMVREDWRHAAELIDILQKNQAEVPEWLQGMADRFGRMKERREAEGGGDRRGRGGFGGRSGGGRSGGRDRRGGGMF
ncbi:putative ATP-dependent RNA helicase DDX43 [Amphibalanus amphitrite]|uniref:RNA helicase n=1 Tax=Amphibalanus amphitrite TaxID=1232801 RepID=A0A6A4WHT7_AMPAM|nr:putative ATP-dependent RNA helicase DDX43 [Amphibalanus amphitrite]